MSLSPGSIDTNDLSPNAGILGTQIADNTIQFRNLLQTDVFKVVESGSFSFAWSVSGINSSTYNYGYVTAKTTTTNYKIYNSSTPPIVLVYEYDSAAAAFFPVSNNQIITQGIGWTNSTNNANYNIFYQLGVYNTNFVLSVVTTGYAIGSYSGAGASSTDSIQYYVLQQNS
jgi:hypothetical protein